MLCHRIGFSGGRADPCRHESHDCTVTTGILVTPCNTCSELLRLFLWWLCLLVTHVMDTEGQNLFFLQTVTEPTGVGYIQKQRTGPFL